MDDLRQRVAALEEKVARMEERRERARRRRKRIGFEVTDVEGASVQTSARTHEQDSEPDEFDGGKRR